MKARTLVSLLLAIGSKAHSIFQNVKVNGVDQGFLVGVRAPDSDFPLESVNDGDFACNRGFHQPVSSTIINIPAGAQVGALWGHVLGGAQYANDPDNPIARSHKGPIQVYLAKVNNAASSGTTGLGWFKVASEGLSGSRWGVDTMISGGGWWYFTMPSCIAPGNYLMRVELIALHGALNTGGAQFYMSCAQINVTGSGSFSPGSTVSFPGAYSSNDPGILVNIYDNSGQPTNGGRSYIPPGPSVISCSGSNSGEGGSSSSQNPTPTSSASGSGQTLYGQCGGQGWSGPTTCVSGTCKVSNQWYSQCLP
ncbi:family 61 glycosyl hydrolase [Serendipita vermifera]|nr:family 61 glycosyl hydrolase [Serendipita vermifera]